MLLNRVCFGKKGQCVFHVTVEEPGIPLKPKLLSVLRSAPESRICEFMETMTFSVTDRKIS